MGESGIGDILQSGFFSPKDLTASGWTWGVGPAILLPTGSEDALTTDQWGLGPTAVALKQSGPWTVGGLANHIWNITDDDDKPGINATFLQPFPSYILPTKTTLTVNSESTYDWDAEEWSIPINFVVAQMANLGNRPIQLSAVARYWADSPDNAADDWGYRLQITFLFPKKLRHSFPLLSRKPC